MIGGKRLKIGRNVYTACIHPYYTDSTLHQKRFERFLQGYKPGSKRKMRVGSKAWQRSFIEEYCGFVLADIQTFECPICLDNVSTTFQVPCSCGSIICEACCYRWIQSNYAEPHCSECQVRWTDNFLIAHLYAKWVQGAKPGELRYLIKQRLLEVEQAKVPETLTLVQQILETTPYSKTSPSKKKAFWNTYANLTGQAQRVATRKPSSHYNYVCPCPKRKCKGLVDKAWACVLCKTAVCKACREIVADTETHHCNPTTVATVRSTLRNTKPCPKCAVPIYRMWGCDQMWCTQCNTPFSWCDGSLITTTIHNPHALEWMRTHDNPAPARPEQNAFNDNPCTLPNMCFMTPRYGYGYNTRVGNLLLIESMYRAIAEIIEWMPRFKTAYQRAVDNFRKYRVRYILGDFTDKVYAQHLFRLDRRVKRMRTYHDLFETLRMVGLRVFHQIAQHDLTEMEGKRTLEELRNFVNQTIKKELPLLGKTLPIYFNWYRNYERYFTSLIA